MKYLVTGGGGFLGRYICKLLVEEGHEVVSFNRNHYPELEAIGIKCFVGDIKNKDDLLLAMVGIDGVFHTAAMAGIWGNKDQFYRINTFGTKNVIEACIEKKVKKLVYTSSPSVIFEDKDLEGVDERSPYARFFYSEYVRSKKIAEEMILQVNQNDLLTVSLRPHLIWGPGDNHIIPKLIQRAKSGKLKIVGDGKNLVDIIYVENAAKAHILAMDNLLEGSSLCAQAYFIGQEDPVNLWQFINQILEACHIKKVSKRIPFKLAFSIGRISEKVYRLRNEYKVDPPMTRFLSLQLAKSHYFSHEKARKDFGYRPWVSTGEGLKRLGKYINEEGRP